MISWIAHHGRSADLARVLDLDAVFIAAGRVANPATAAMRWTLQAVRTVVLLGARRPDALVLMAPPWLLVAIALVYRRLRRARVPVVVDAHTSAVFSTRTGRTSAGLRVLGRFCDAVITHNDVAAGEAQAHAARVVVLHDPPVTPAGGGPGAAAAPSSPFTFVYPCSWYGDEPVEAVAEAARRLPGARFVLTGRPDRARLPADLPVNLELTGYVDDAAFDALLAAADGVLALTTREATMQRAGYEAMAYGKPLVASATQALRGFFGDAAVYTEATPDGIARACAEAVAQREQLTREMVVVRDQRRREFDVAIAAVRELLTS